MIELRPLAGASFVVRDENSATANYLIIDPVTKAVAWTNSPEKATTFNTTNDGLVDITGLAYGTYYLEETKAPNSYIKLNERIAFKVDAQSYAVANELVLLQKKYQTNRKEHYQQLAARELLCILVLGVVLLTIVGVYWIKRYKA